jgi:hypothetical protein
VRACIGNKAEARTVQGTSETLCQELDLLINLFYETQAETFWEHASFVSVASHHSTLLLDDSDVFAAFCQLKMEEYAVTKCCNPAEI